MFTRCCSLSAAEEIKVKQKQGRERQSRGKKKREKKKNRKRGDEEIKRAREERKGEGCRSRWVVRGEEHTSVKDALFGCEKCVIKVSLMFCCAVPLCADDVHAQVHITQNILQMLRSERRPTHRRAGCAATPPLDSGMVTPLMQSTSVVTNTMRLMSCLT